MLGRWTRTLANASELSVQAYFDRTHLRDPFGASPFAPAGFLIDDLDTYDFSLQHRLAPAGRHTLVWGGGYRLLRDNVRQDAPNLTFVPAQRDQSLGNLFLQDEISLTPSFALIVGTKLEHNDYTGVEIEPNVRARWRLADDQLVWAAISRAVRTPTRLDRDLAEPAPPTVLISGGSEFAAETLLAYELGYRATLGAALSGSLSFFYNDYDRLRGLAVTPVTFVPLVYRNSLEADSYGAELSAEYRPGERWRLRAGYAYVESDVRVKPGQSDFFNALDETADPRHQLSLHTSVDVTPRVEFDTGLRWVDTLRVNNNGAPATVPSYWELDLRLGWRLNDTLEFSLVGRNLLHAHHPEFGPPGPSRAELDRSVALKAECRF